MGVGRARRELRGRLQVADTNHIPGALLCNPPPVRATWELRQCWSPILSGEQWHPLDQGKGKTAAWQLPAVHGQAGTLQQPGITAWEETNHVPAVPVSA